MKFFTTNWVVNSLANSKQGYYEGKSGVTNYSEELFTSYFIKPGWIVTNQKEGFIKLSYKAVATDGRGYPLIPDSSSYQEAIYWYVTMKLSFPKFMNGTLGGRSRNSTGVYQYIQ